MKDSPLEGKDINSDYNAIRVIAEAWTDETFSEIVNDRKYIFPILFNISGIILFNLALGIIGTTMDVVGTILSNYPIYIVTG